MSKKNLIILSLSIVLASVLNSFNKVDIDESQYVNDLIRYSIERDGSKVILSIDLQNLASYDEILVKRSESPSGDFRQVKYLSHDQVLDLSYSNTITDKYPLPGNLDTYYKVITISNEGVYKLFPCVKLDKY